ncbi:MAG: DUF4136 domain-containing protein [Chitinivorax sp.]
MYARPLQSATLSLLLLGAAGCSTADISADHSTAIPISAGATFVWATATQPPPASGKIENADFDNDIVRQRIQDAIDGELQHQGLAPATDPANADFVVSYHIGVSRKQSVTASPEMTTIMPMLHCSARHCWSGLSWGYWGPPLETRRTYEYREGSLIIDLQQRSSNRLAWRGIYRERLGDTAKLSDKAIYRIVADTMKGLVQ